MRRKKLVGFVLGFLVLGVLGATDAAAPPTCFGLAATPGHLGSSGEDDINGTAGADVIIGLGDDDTINGNGGNDRICGNGGNDDIDAGTGNDFVKGGPGNDELDGSDGNDDLRGQDGADQLDAGPGADKLSGGPGSPDECDGDTGTDTHTGGCEQRDEHPLSGSEEFPDSCLERGGVVRIQLKVCAPRSHWAADGSGLHAALTRRGDRRVVRLPQHDDVEVMSASSSREPTAATMSYSSEESVRRRSLRTSRQGDEDDLRDPAHVYGNDEDGRALRHDVVELLDVGPLHPDAAVTGAAADRPGLRCAVDDERSAIQAQRSRPQRVTGAGADVAGHRPRPRRSRIAPRRVLRLGRDVVDAGRRREAQRADADTVVPCDVERLGRDRA